MSYRVFKHNQEYGPRKGLMMEKLLITLGFLTSFSAMAGVTPLAQCGETNGYSFIPNYKEDKTLKEKAAEQVLGKSLAPARWVTDGFKNGSIFLVQQDSGTLDIVIYNNPRQETFSTIKDGGKIYLLRKSADDIAVLVVYPTVTEIYTFMKSKEGATVSVLQSKNHNSITMRTSMMTGNCKFVNIDALKN